MPHAASVSLEPATWRTAAPLTVYSSFLSPPFADGAAIAAHATTDAAAVKRLSHDAMYATLIQDECLANQVARKMGSPKPSQIEYLSADAAQQPSGDLSKSCASKRDGTQRNCTKRVEHQRSFASKR